MSRVFTTDDKEQIEELKLMADYARDEGHHNVGIFYDDLADDLEWLWGKVESLKSGHISNTGSDKQNVSFHYE